MSLVLQCFGDQPVVGPSDAGDPDQDSYGMTLVPQTIDELGRLWHAIGTPMRLSALYRVSVTFLEPKSPDSPDA